MDASVAPLDTRGPSGGASFTNNQIQMVKQKPTGTITYNIVSRHPSVLIRRARGACPKEAPIFPARRVNPTTNASFSGRNQRVANFTEPKKAQVDPAPIRRRPKHAR